jgi:hypothetical protein
LPDILEEFGIENRYDSLSNLPYDTFPENFAPENDSLIEEQDE